MPVARPKARKEALPKFAGVLNAAMDARAQFCRMGVIESAANHEALETALLAAEARHIMLETMRSTGPAGAFENLLLTALLSMPGPASVPRIAPLAEILLAEAGMADQMLAMVTAAYKNVPYTKPYTDLLAEAMAVEKGGKPPEYKRQAQEAVRAVDAAIQGMMPKKNR